MTLRILGSFSPLPERNYAFGWPGGIAMNSILEAASGREWGQTNNFFIPEELFPKESTGAVDIGYWEVDRQEHIPSKTPYRAIRLLVLPPEIIALGVPSRAIDEIRNVLFERGIESTSALVNRQLFLEFTDGRIAGPVFVSSADGDVGQRRYILRSRRPLPLWHSVDDLHPVNVRHRRFCLDPGTKPADLLDLATTQEVLAELFAIGAKHGPGSFVLSDEQRDLLIQRLSAIRDEQLPLLHRQRAERLFQETVAAGKHLDVWWNSLIALPGIHDRLLAWKKAAVDRDRPTWETEFESLQRNLLQLRKEKKTLEDGIGGLRKRAEQSRDEILSVLTHLRDQLPVQQPPDAFEVKTDASEPRSINALADAETHLELNIEGLGLAKPAARDVSREVLSALAVGQPVFFSGSLAGPLARRCVGALSAARWIALEVSVGMVEPIWLKRAMEAAVAAGGLTRVGLLLSGVNRSDLDAYGTPLLNVVRERCLGTPSADWRLMVFGTVVGGPSALPPVPALTTLGPVIHADGLAWSGGAPRHDIRPAQLTAQVAPASPSCDTEDLKKWLDRLPGPRIELWRRNVLAAFRQLCSWSGEGHAISSLVASWIIPHCLASGTDWGDAFQEGLLRLLGENAWPERMRHQLQAAGVSV
jgi:hypothetical protein